MPNKKYALAAWTEKGQLRMIPTVVNEVSAPYREKIARLEAMYKDVENEVGWLLAQSRAHEEFARFLESVGYPKEAFEEFKNAAIICLCCSDGLWRQGVVGDYPVLTLYHRFLAMHRQCMRLTETHPSLKAQYLNSDFYSTYLWITTDEREFNREFDQAMETCRAWRFGQAG